MDDVWEVTGRHAWDDLRPLLDDGVIDEGHYSPSEHCELHFKVFSMHQSAKYWDVALYRVDDAVDADCTCPHGCVVGVDFASRRGSVGVDRSRLWLVVACTPRCDAPFKCKHTCACLVKAWSIKHPEALRAWRCKLAVRGRVSPLDFSRRRDQKCAHSLPWLARARADGTTECIFITIERALVRATVADNGKIVDGTRRWSTLSRGTLPLIGKLATSTVDTT
jgi:hypothetical protein